MKKRTSEEKKGPSGESNSGPLAPKARIIPLDHKATCLCSFPIPFLRRETHPFPSFFKQTNKQTSKYQNKQTAFYFSKFVFRVLISFSIISQNCSHATKSMFLKSRLIDTTFTFSPRTSAGSATSLNQKNTPRTTPHASPPIPTITKQNRGTREPPSAELPGLVSGHHADDSLPLLRGEGRGVVDESEAHRSAVDRVRDLDFLRLQRRFLRGNRGNGVLSE